MIWWVGVGVGLGQMGWDGVGWVGWDGVGWSGVGVEFIGYI